MADIKKAEITYAPRFGLRHFQIFLMMVCATVIYVTRSSMGAAILAMTDTNVANNTDIEIYVWSEEVRGVILSSFFWGYTAMQIPGGILCKHFGGKLPLLIALVVSGLMALATPILARFGDWVAVCLMRVCMGLTQACFMPGIHTLLGQWVPPGERTRLGIIAYAGIQIGTIITMPICGVLANTIIGWKLIYYSMGGLSLVTAALWWCFAASTPRQHRFIKAQEADYIEQSLNSKTEEEVPIPWRKILTSVPLLAIVCTHVGVNWCFVTFLVQIPAYLKNVLGLNLANSAALAALPYTAYWMISMIGGFVSDYLINNKTITVTTSRKLFNSIGAIGTSLGLVALSFITSEHKTLAVILLTFTCGIGGASTCGYMMNHIDLSPRFGGVLYGLTNCIANLVAILSPISTGFILGEHSTEISRWRIVFFLAASMIFFTDIIYRLFGSSDLQEWNNPQEIKYNKGYLKKDSLIRYVKSEDIEKVFNFPEEKKNLTA